MLRWLALATIFLFFVSSGVAKGETISVEHCNLTIRILPEQHSLEATATIQVLADPEPREILTFALRSDMEVTQAEVLSPKQSAVVVTVYPIRIGKEPGSATQWEIRLRQPIPAQTPVTVKLSYTGGKTQGLVFYLGPEGCFAGGPNTKWYPRFGKQRSAGTLQFTVPRGFVVHASGVAAGQKDTETESTYSFTVKQPSLFSFTAGRYQVCRSAGKVPVTLYLLKDRPFTDLMVSRCRRVLQVLEKEFGPYPYGEFAVAETPSPQSSQSGFGGASCEGFMMVDTGFLRQGFNLALFGHEIAHQWWGNLVQHTGERGAYMLDEALAQYGALRCVQEIEGSAAAARFRRTGYPGYVEMQCGRGAALVAAIGADLPLSQLQGDLAHYLADCKGFLTYHLLARTMGRDKFRAAIQHIAATHAFGKVTWEEFLRVVQQEAGQDLAWFYRQWFDRPGLPRLALQWKQEGQTLQIRIRQESPTYRLKVPLRIVREDGRTLTQDIEVTDAQTELRLTQRQAVITVTLDPDYEVVHMDPALQSEAEALRFWIQGSLLRNQGKREAAQQKFTEGLQNLPEHDTYGVEFLLRNEIAAEHYRSDRLEEARREYERALVCPVRIANKLPRLYLTPARIALAQKDTSRLIEAIRNTQNADLALDYPTGAGQEASDLRNAPANP